VPTKRLVPPRKKPLVSKPVESKETCFTIMPFGGWFDSYYESIYVPAIKAAGLEPCRADDLYRPSTIIHDIWSYTQSAKLVLADLSGKNANVFYELGLAHALAKPAILVTESMDDVPFDLRALRVLEYNKNEPRWGEVLREKITLSIQEVLKAPIQSVLPAFLTVKQESKTKAVSEQEKIFLELKREIDLLRNEVSRSRMTSRPQISSSEARDRIEMYVRRGMQDDEILDRLFLKGVPRSWLIDQLQTTRSKDTSPQLELDANLK
jgi:hypothetical protein